eukprot:TRINITY_DN13985_c0_g1_i1.p1 TRINITY_DN13985_c0_g1~~TRINITY_DN13985_c0_g1_i1.p1  ORF type:complete len:543 (+),score=117.25 TRINITY_DN13985_c0_g1_i1:36-1664(+)
MNQETTRKLLRNRIIAIEFILNFIHVVILLLFLIGPADHSIFSINVGKNGYYRAFSYTLMTFTVLFSTLFFMPQIESPGQKGIVVLLHIISIIFFILNLYIDFQSIFNHHVNIPLCSLSLVFLLFSLKLIVDFPLKGSDKSLLDNDFVVDITDYWNLDKTEEDTVNKDTNTFETTFLKEEKKNKGCFSQFLSILFYVFIFLMIFFPLLSFVQNMTQYRTLSQEFHFGIRHGFDDTKKENFGHMMIKNFATNNDNLLFFMNDLAYCSELYNVVVNQTIGKQISSILLDIPGQGQSNYNHSFIYEPIAFGKWFTKMWAHYQNENEIFNYCSQKNHHKKRILICTASSCLYARDIMKNDDFFNGYILINDLTPALFFNFNLSNESPNVGDFAISNPFRLLGDVFGLESILDSYKFELAIDNSQNDHIIVNSTQNLAKLQALEKSSWSWAKQQISINKETVDAFIDNLGYKFDYNLCDIIYNRPIVFINTKFMFYYEKLGKEILDVKKQSMCMSSISSWVMKDLFLTNLLLSRENLMEEIDWVIKN